MIELGGLEFKTALKRGVINKYQLEQGYTIIYYNLKAFIVNDQNKLMLIQDLLFEGPDFRFDNKDCNLLLCDKELYYYSVDQDALYQIDYLNIKRLRKTPHIQGGGSNRVAVVDKQVLVTNETQFFIYNKEINEFQEIRLYDEKQKIIYTNDTGFEQCGSRVILSCRQEDYTYNTYQVFNINFAKFICNDNNGSKGYQHQGICQPFDDGYSLNLANTQVTYFKRDSQKAKYLFKSQHQKNLVNQLQQEYEIHNGAHQIKKYQMDQQLSNQFLLQEQSMIDQMQKKFEVAQNALMLLNRNKNEEEPEQDNEV